MVAANLSADSGPQNSTLEKIEVAEHCSDVPHLSLAIHCVYGHESMLYLITGSYLHFRIVH